MIILASSAAIMWHISAFSFASATSAIAMSLISALFRLFVDMLSAAACARAISSSSVGGRPSVDWSVILRLQEMQIARRHELARYRVIRGKGLNNLGHVANDIAKVREI